MVGHKGQREGAEKSDQRRKLPRKEIDHRDGKGSENQGDDPEVPFGLGKRVQLMGENEEEGRMKIRRILFIKFYLAVEIISGIVECMDFVHPERFLIKGVESQAKTDEKTNDEDNDFFTF